MKTNRMKFRATRCALFTALSGICCGYALAQERAADEICTFQTSSAYYATVTGPGEFLRFEWRKSTGAVREIQWVTGGVPWYQFTSQPGAVVPESFPNDYHLRVNLGMTTAGYDASRYEVRGYVTTNISLPNATFAGVFEGSGTSWIVADGQLTCESDRAQQSRSSRR